MIILDVDSQDAMAGDLATELTNGETAWLDADAG